MTEQAETALAEPEHSPCPSSRRRAFDIWQVSLVVLILLSFGRGAWALGTKSLWWDESLSLYRARQGVPAILSNQTVLTDNTQELVTVDNHPPLYFLGLRVVVLLAGESEFALRFPSLACAVLLVPLLYAAGRAWVGRRAGLAAAAVGAVSPMLLWYGQEARGYTMLAFLGLLSVYLCWQAFFRAAQGWRRLGRIVAYVVASVALILTHYLGAMLVGYELLVLALAFARWPGIRPLLQERRSGRRAAIATIAVLLVAMAVPLAYIWLNRPQATAKVGWRFIPLLNLLRDLLNSFSLGLSVDVGRWYVLALDFLFLAVAIVGLAWLALSRYPVPKAGLAARRRSAWLLVGYLLIPVALTYLLSYVRPVYMNSRHLILVLPAFCLLVGTGLSAISLQVRRRPVGAAASEGLAAGSGRLAWCLGFIAVCAALLGGVCYSTVNYFADPAYDKDHHREWGAYLREHVRPGDVVVVDPPCISELYGYYAGSDVPWVGLPLLSGPRQQTVDKLMGLVGSYDRVWLAFSHTPPWCDPRRFPEKWLNQNAFRVDYQEFESYSSVVLVAAYVARRPTVRDLPDGSYLVEARYSSALRLVGYRPVSSASPGRSLHVELFWAVDEPVTEEASVVLRLVGPAGQTDRHLWSQGEQCPFNGLYPMWQWEPGMIVRDEHELMIAPGTPPGRYELEAMLVSRPTEEGCLGERGAAMSPIAGATVRGDRVLLGEVEVDRSSRPAAASELGIEQLRRAKFGGLALLGDQVGAVELRAGDPLDVALYWQALQSSLPDSQFRLALLDETCQGQPEIVIRPAGDGYPTDRWQVGDRFKGQFRLWLPEESPPGEYTLWLEPAAGSGAAQRGVLPTVRRWLGSIAGSGCRPDGGLLLGQVAVLPTSQEGAAALPLRPTDLAVSQPVEVTLGGQVRLLGFDLGTDTIQAGESIALTLYWQGLRPMELSYHVFTHLAGPKGQPVAQKDGVPRDGAYPTVLWQTGEVVVDRYLITVDPTLAPGTYPLEVGMYRLETLRRLPMSDGDGQRVAGDGLVLAEINVLPAPTPTPAPPVLEHYLPIIGQ